MVDPARPFHRYTYEEYLELEQDSPVKHEYFGGEIYALAGGTPEHAALAMAVATLLGSQLADSPCRLFSSDLRVRVLSSGLATYPDLTVIRGPLEREAAGSATAVNPTLVVEVTSPSSEDYDRGDKLDHYKTIESLRWILVVSHRAAQIDSWSRSPDGSWTKTVATAGQRVLIGEACLRARRRPGVRRDTADALNQSVVIERSEHTIGANRRSSPTRGRRTSPGRSRCRTDPGTTCPHSAVGIRRRSGCFRRRTRGNRGRSGSDFR
jgi:Uma2 family endonuclease